MNGFFIFFHVEENEPKEDAVPRLTLRVPSAVGRAETHSAFSGAQTVAASF
jgi:hypothetical protein